MEKELVRQLGEKIGYGNMMQLASECWEEMMIAKGYPTSGVFIPALKSDVRGLKIDTGKGQSNIPDVTTMLPRESDMENKISDAKQHQSNEHQQFKDGYELGYRHCYSWMVRIISLFGN